MRGKIRIYHPRKGYGWVQTEENIRIWFHVSQWEKNGSREPRPGDVVSYELGEDDQGRDVAKQIRLFAPTPDICGKTDSQDRGYVADPIDPNAGLLRFLRPNPRREGAGDV